MKYVMENVELLKQIKDNGPQMRDMLHIARARIASDTYDDKNKTLVLIRP